jgi:hypothetical protein
LASALEALERSFHVRLIGTFGRDIVWASPDANATDWLARNCPQFDQFPVRDGEKTVGVLIRNGDHGDKRVEQAMVGVRDGLIVSGDMPIADLIPELRSNHFRLVLRGGRIDGLVTQSDLLKLPVRMLLFGLVTHAESSFRSMVLSRYPDDAWLTELSDDRRQGVTGRMRKLRKAKLDPDLIECTYLEDVIELVKKDPGVPLDMHEDLESVHELRNPVAHVRAYVNSPSDVRKFVDQFDAVRRCIRMAQELLEVAG